MYTMYFNSVPDQSCHRHRPFYRTCFMPIYRVGTFGKFTPNWRGCGKAIIYPLRSFERSNASDIIIVIFDGSWLDFVKYRVRIHLQQAVAVGNLVSDIVAYPDYCEIHSSFLIDAKRFALSKNVTMNKTMQRSSTGWLKFGFKYEDFIPIWGDLYKVGETKLLK